MYDIREQIDTLQSKLAYYERKKTLLEQRITDAESKRESVNRLLVGDPKVYKFYKHLNLLYTQLATLSAKISRFRDNISTLKCELQWN